MEKIYENKTNPRKTNFTKKNITFGLTLGVALIAIVSVLALSVSRSSYALDEVTSLPEKIHTSIPNVSTDGLVGSMANAKTIFPYTDTGTGAKLFCLESREDYAADIDMSKGSEITDKGLIYLASKLNNLTVTPSDFSGITEDQASAIDTWVKQNAYWYYLASIGDPKSDSNYGTADNLRRVAQETKLKQGTSSTEYFPADNETAFFDKFGITNWITTAIQFHSSADPILNVSVTKASNDWTKKDGGYKSGKITVKFSGASGFAGLVDTPTTYSLSLNGAPSGTKVYGVNQTTNKEVDVTSSLNNLSVNTYSDFYIVVPESSVQKNTNYSISVAAKGAFKQYSGYYYQGTDPDTGEAAQRVTTIQLTNVIKENGTDLALTITEDTALDVSQSIYFIGLIVLLSGLGILYANVKKQKEY